MCGGYALLDTEPWEKTATAYRFEVDGRGDSTVTSPPGGREDVVLRAAHTLAGRLGRPQRPPVEPHGLIDELQGGTEQPDRDD